MSQSPTNKKFKKPSPKFDASAFARDILKGESGVASALERLRIAIYSGSDVLSELLSDEHKHLFEYTFSILDDDGLIYVLREELLLRLHLDDGSLMPSGSPILERLSKFIYFLPFTSDDAKPESLLENYRFVSDSQEALRALTSIGFLEQMTPTTNQSEGEIFGKKSRRPSSPKQMKHEKRSRANTIRIDERPFERLNEPVPSTREEAQMLALQLIRRRKELLAEFTDLLRTPSLSSVIRELYISTSVVQHPNKSPKTLEPEAHVPPVEAEIHDEVPAYPHIQPVKASLYFDNADGFGEWAIIISDSACKDLRAYVHEPPIFQAILTKLKELSNGVFSEDNQKRLKGPDKGIPVFEVRFLGRLTGDLRLVYQVDVLSESVDRESQVIRVFGIFTHAQMDDRMWASLSAQLTVRGPEYCRRINFRRQGPSGKGIFLPQSWPDISEEKEASADANIKSLVSQAYQEQLHKWLVLEKYTAFSQALLDCILADKDSSTVFSVSAREREIIEHPSSCYVLGRSGTGKTTTMAFKIFGIERTAKTSMDSETRPRQLFVTQSPVLADKVREYHTKLSDFLSAASGMPLSRSSEQLQGEDELGDPEGGDDWGSNLPKRFSELEEKHFPLFLTFDKLCRLLEADMGLSFTRPSLKKKRRRDEKRNNITDPDLEDPTGIGSAVADTYAPSKEAERYSCVTFETFCSDYWPHFPQNLTKHLDPALVFSELIGVIKGSDQTLKSENNYLNRDEYFSLSERTRPISAKLRGRIYSLFEKYMSMKREYGDHDLADRCHAIFQCMKGGHKYSVDFLYVDEAQDNLIVDAFVLRMLCQNPHGLFWAGDSAQTIAIGSSFRFDDLKSALYSFERKLYPSLDESGLVQPSFFQLTTNYRSHGGIVNCAWIIIELIVHFWPNSIDTLKKEKGLVDGAKPIFFTSSNDETARYEQFLLGDDGKAIEFGARQCILVRNEHAKNKLREQVGDVGIILTLYESKGLEFDDVLLYDFFADSQYDMSRWRVVLNFLQEPSNSNIAAPLFDEIRHAGICTELKFLYVAVTRARKNLWIIDRSENGDPIKTLLSDLGRIDVLTPDKAPKLAEATSPQEWEKVGKELFRSEKYAQAMHCFERVGLRNELAVAEAFHLRQQARRVARRSERECVKAFSKAGHAFFSCAQRSQGSGTNYYRIAAACFQESREYNRVAEAYEKARQFDDAARYYVKATQFDDAVRIVTKENSIHPGLKERIIGAARLHYTHMEEFEKAMELSDTQKDYLEFLDDFGLDVAKAEVLEKIGLLPQAADAYFHSGNEERAIQLFIKDFENPSSLRRATEYVLESLWKQTPFGLDGECDHAIANHLVILRGRHHARLPVQIVEQLDMFNAINRRDRVALLKAYGMFFWTRNNPQAAALILDRLLTIDYVVNDAEEAIQYAQASFAYASILRQVWNSPDLTENVRTQWLFGFLKSSEQHDEFVLSKNGFLAAYLRMKLSSARGRRGGLVHDSRELTRIIKMAIQSRLSDVLHSQDNICSGAHYRLFGDPCLAHATGTCNQDNCTRQHVDFKSADLEWFEMRVRFHLFQIRFLHAADFALQRLKNRHGLRNKWLSNLLAVLNPSLSAHGGLTNIGGKWSREFKFGMDVVSLWMKERAYKLSSVSSGDSLNRAIDVVVFLVWHDLDEARKLLPRMRFVTGNGLHFAQNLAQSMTLDLVTCLSMFGPDFIVSGCRFMQCIVEDKLQISIDHLCQVVELLCASCILLFANDSGSFHNCLLPRTWLFNVAPRIDLNRSYEIRRRSWMLIQQCGGLASYLLLGSVADLRHVWGASAFIVRSISIHKILRAVALVGYNTTVERRDSIIELVRNLRVTCETDVHRLVKPFLMSHNWSDLRRAAERTYFPSSLDEMIQLVQVGKPARTALTDAPIRVFPFKDKSNLLSLIRPASAERPSQLSPNAQPFVPGPNMASGTEETRVHIEMSETTVDDVVLDKEEQNGEDEDDREEDMIQPDEKELLAELSAGSVKKEGVDRRDAAARVIQQFYLARRRERAACILQRRYRVILRRRREMDQPNIHGIRATYYWKCVAFDANRNGKWPSAHHRFAYLALVPDLLTCLDTLRDRNQLYKDKEKRRLKSSSKPKGDDYDEVHVKITRANDNRKRLGELKDQLAVPSPWHEHRKKADLEAIVQEIVDFFDRLEVKGDVLDMCLHVQDTVQMCKPQTAKKKERPKLNIADLDVTRSLTSF